MRVIVVGCGRVGSGLASGLSGAGHDVAVIDRDPSAFRRLPSDFSGERLVGVGFDRELLRQAGIEQAAALAAVTNGDNSNIVIARVAKDTFKVDRVVARIYDPRRASIYERLGIATVATARWTIDRVRSHIDPAAREAVWTDPSGRVVVVEHPVDNDLAGIAADSLDLTDAVRMVALRRLGEAMLAPPDLVFQEGDVLVLAVVAEAVAELPSRLRPSEGAH